MQDDVMPQDDMILIEEPQKLTFGEALAEARKAKGYSVEDVVASLKLRPRQVLALEASQLDQLSGPIYARGMIRNYARLVDIDPEPLLAQISMETANTALDSECFTPEKLKVIDHGFRGGVTSILSWRPNRILVYCAGIAIVLGLIIWAVPDNFVTQLGGFAANQKERLGQWCSIASQTKTDDTSEVPEATEMAVVSPEENAAPVEFMASPPALASAKIPDEDKNRLIGRAVSSTMPATQGVLKMTFGEESWVEIREKNSRKTIFSELVAAGTERDVTGNLPLMVKIGNVHAATLTFNGEMVILTPYTQSGVARLLLQ